MTDRRTALMSELYDRIIEFDMRVSFTTPGSPAEEVMIEVTEFLEDWLNQLEDEENDT